MRIFICFPFYSKDKELMNERIKKAKAYTLKLYKEGHIVFSPALTSYDWMMETNESRNTLFPDWEGFCFSLLEPADEIHVLKLTGWETSQGLAGEVKKAEELGKPVSYISM